MDGNGDFRPQLADGTKRSVGFRGQPRPAFRTIRVRYSKEGHAVHQVTVHFMPTPGAGPALAAGLRRAAAILSESLSRQGFDCHREANTVVIDLLNAPEGAVEAVLVVPDPDLLARTDVRQQLGTGQALVVGTARPARKVWQQLDQSPAGVVAVDAAGIAEEEGCDPEVALLGGLARLMPFVDPEALCASVWNAYDTGFAYLARAAMRTFDVGYRQAQLATQTVGAGH